MSRERPRFGAAGAGWPIAAPPARLLRIALRDDGRIRSACLLFTSDSASELRAVVAPMRAAAMKAAQRRWRELAPRLRARLGALRERPFLTRSGCAACRDDHSEPGAPRDADGWRLCVSAGPEGGGVWTAALAAHAPARALLAIHGDFAPAAGEAGLRAELRALAPISASMSASETAFDTAWRQAGEPTPCASC